MTCLFCDRTQHKILCESPSWYARHDNYPANPGHVELVTKRHVVSLFDLDGAESSELFGVLLYARRLVAEGLGTEPDGWTIGVNDGTAAGRSIDHLHIHLIPRWEGDVDDPRGGIRQCAPGWDPDAWTDTPDHVGGNAEDCPACSGTNPPWPFICPGPTKPRRLTEQQGGIPNDAYTADDYPKGM